MQEYNAQELIRSKQDFNKDISNLKKQLNAANEKKEFWFKKKEDLKEEIKKYVRQIKDIKIKTDESNVSITTMKKERDKYNDDISRLIDELTKLNKEKREIFEKYKITEDPYKVQKHIEAIENKLETETSFENEKKLMKRLNALKSIYKESKIRELIEKIDKLNKQLKESNKKASEFHKKIIQTASDRDGYASFILLSRKINDIRKEQENAFNKFIEYKKEFLGVNSRLKDNLAKSSIVQTSLNRIKEAEHRSREESIRQIIMEKTQHVLDKFKKKKKLTTEDLIILQGGQR